jgi:quercetin dioxygenase-like cupin family protein
MVVTARPQRSAGRAQRTREVQLKIALSAMFSAVALGACLAAAVPGQAADPHTILTPSEVQWKPGPPFMRPGVQAAVIYGDPSKEGLFVLRLKFPKGYVLSPHMHPVNELVTVISGLSQLGMGEKADQSQAEKLPPGSFFFLPPGMAHYAFFDEETIIQISTIGPWAVTYVNPADDPRNGQ